MSSRVRTWMPGALVACALACALALATSAGGASSGTVVSASVPSASLLDNDCTSSAATELGAMTPGSLARTATDASVCRVTFGSSNSTAQLRIMQKDGTGTAMALGMQAPTQLAALGAPGRTLGAFSSPDGQTGWLAGRSATLYRSLNAGATWGFSFSGISGNHTDVEFEPGKPQNVWITGEGRYLRRSTDGLAATPTFVNMATPLANAGWPSSVDINELAIPDDDTIVIVGNSRWFAVGDISANTWQAFQHSNSSIGNIRAVDALDSTTFIAVGDNDRALITTNAGTTSADWSVMTISPAGADLVDVAWGGTNRAYAVGERGVVSVWNGTTWTDRTTNLGLGLDLIGVDSIPGLPDTVLVLDERGGVHRSDDAGLTWSSTSTGSASRAGDLHATVNGVYVAQAERSFSVSANGGASFALNGPSGSQQLTGVAASPTNGQRLLAVGDTAWRSTDGGGSWTESAIPGGGLNAVTLVDDDRGWAVGDGARIRATSDLGATWTTQAAPAGITARLLAVHGRDAHEAVAVGDGGTIVRTVNGGATWTSEGSGTTQQLLGIDRRDELLLAVGARGTIVRSTDGGDSWSLVTGGSIPDPSDILVDVAIASDTVAYAATSEDQVWKTTDAGLTWSQLAATTGTNANAIAASGSSLIVVGDAFSTARSFDGGATWTQVTGPTMMHILDVVAVDPHTAIMVGADGTRARSVAEPAATAQVPDYASGSNDWSTGGFFGVCMQAVAGAAVADWVADTTNSPGTCEALDADPWRAVPATGSLAAHTNAPGTGSVDLVWGFRAASNQMPGRYEAAIAFEAIAP